MAAASGRNILIRIKNDVATPAFVPFVGLQTKNISMNGEIVDITHSDSSGQWRELLPSGGIKSLSVSGGGVSQDKPTLVVLQDALFDGTLRDTEMVVPGFGTIACKCAVTAFTIPGEYNGEVRFELSLESSGVVTFTVEP